MKTKRLFWVFITLISAAVSLAAQQGPVFAPFVSRLEGKLDNNRVVLSWVDSGDVTGPVYVYRSAAPFIETELLEEMTPVEIPYGTQAYTDETEPGETVFYFVVASDENGLRYDYPIVNNNTVSVRGAAGTGMVTLPPGEDDAGLKRPRVFVRDISAQAVAATPAAAAGEEQALASIVRGPFAARDWESAKDELAAFLSAPRKSETTARAKFYLGQCSYFLRQPEDGLFEFVAFQAMYPGEASGWIQASLDMMGD